MHVVQYSFQMLEGDETQKNNTQMRILKLLDDLKNSDNKSQKHFESMQTVQAEQVRQFRKQMQTKFQIINQKIDTAITVIDEVARQRSEKTDYKRKLKLTTRFDENIDDLKRDTKDFYDKQTRQLEDIEKRYKDRMLDIKLMVTEQEEREKHELNFFNNQILVSHLNKVKKVSKIQQNDKELRELQFRNRIKKLKRDIAEDSVKNKTSFKKVKNALLNVLQKTVEEIQKEQQTMKESFELHVQTLQKIIVSISDKIE